MKTPTKTDLDLPPYLRTQANLWKAKYFEMYLEVLKANKGIRRLKKKLDKRNPYLQLTPNEEKANAKMGKHRQRNADRL